MESFDDLIFLKNKDFFEENVFLEGLRMEGWKAMRSCALLENMPCMSVCTRSCKKYTIFTFVV